MDVEENVQRNSMHQPDQGSSGNPQLLFVGRQDTVRLLEVYVHRSLSLNDGRLGGGARRRGDRDRKWVTVTQRKIGLRRHSSDTSIHLGHAAVGPDVETDAGELDETAFRCGDLAPPQGEPAISDKPGSRKKSALKKRWQNIRDKTKRPGKTPKPAPLDPTPAPPSGEAEDREPRGVQLEASTESSHKPKESKRGKKPSFWRSIVGFFSGGDSDSEEREPSRERAPVCPPQPVTEAPTSTDESLLRRRKSSKKRLRRKLSLKLERPSSVLVDAVERVEPTDSYYENVTNELMRIVTEVKDSPTEEHVPFAPAQLPTESDTQTSQTSSSDDVVDKLIALIKQQGDFIDAKIKECPQLSSYFQSLTYGSFMQLADEYVKSEIPVEPAPGPGPVVAPELVKLAFTLDFTARLASLSRQSPSHIMGMGNRYLQDRFTYMTQAPPLSCPTQEHAPPPPSPIQEEAPPLPTAINEEVTPLPCPIQDEAPPLPCHGQQQAPPTTTTSTIKPGGGCLSSGA